MTERAPSQPTAAPFRVTRILCPTDFSPASDGALAAAEGIAQSFGARIDLLHVWAPQIAMALDAALIPSPAQIVKYTEELERALAKRAASLALAKERVETHLVQGIPWREVGAVAASEHCDLIVMSTHGHTGFTHLLMGSVTERVVRSSRVPVLVVPAVG